MTRKQRSQRETQAARVGIARAALSFQLAVSGWLFSGLRLVRVLLACRFWLLVDVLRMGHIGDMGPIRKRSIADGKTADR